MDGAHASKALDRLMDGINPIIKSTNLGVSAIIDGTSTACYGDAATNRGWVEWRCFLADLHGVITAVGELATCVADDHSVACSF